MDPPPVFDEECFLISPIGAEGSSTRRQADDGREFIVKPAVMELGLTPVRADEIAQPGQITLQIIQHVLKAKAAVADLTGANPNVFYELAVRHTARLPVVLIAHVDDRAQLPFDIAQMRTIFYDHKDLKSAADCRMWSAAQLREALERGAVNSPVAASITLAQLQVGSPSDQVLAQLVSAVEGIASDNANNRETMLGLALVGLSREARDTASSGDALTRRLHRLEELARSRDDPELVDLTGVPTTSLRGTTLSVSRRSHGGVLRGGLAASRGGFPVCARSRRPAPIEVRLQWDARRRPRTALAPSMSSLLGLVCLDGRLKRCLRCG